MRADFYLEPGRFTLQENNELISPQTDGATVAAALLRSESKNPLLQALQLRRDDASAPLPSFAGARLVGADLSNMNLTGANFSGADLSRANLESAVLLGADLSGATLFETNLERAELGGANLAECDLRGVNFTNASLGQARLDGARLDDAKLDGASLVACSATGTSFELAALCGARLNQANLIGASFAKANLREACLDEAQVGQCDFTEADLHAASLRYLNAYRQACWVGVDMRDVDFTGAYLLRRHMQDQNYLFEFRNQSKMHHAVYWVWWLTSDCGRSLVRWGLFTTVLVLAFAGAYTMVNVDYGAHATPLSPIYFSLVTMTTLGYGDVLPASIPAQVVTMLEVSAGYLMLGGLVSILSSKFARRAE